MTNGTIIGTLKSKGAADVEFVKKCVVCKATLIVERQELAKDRHEMCGWANAATAFGAPAQRSVA